MSEPRTDQIVIVRLIRGVTSHFKHRASDWFLTCMMLNFGLVLLSPADTFSLSSSYIVLKQMMSENAWGVICLVIGLVRISALIVNGTFPSFRWSPHIRSVCAALSCVVWFWIAIGFEAAHNGSTALAIYRYLVLFDVLNAFVAGSEAAEAEEKQGSKWPINRQ